ncbi:MAG: tetratricopeptide repeat protein, partial [Sandaracinaceae bacterium]|nr:tetratricopeptide repeat protein [Sandaracinaceae bacterium]
MNEEIRQNLALGREYFEKREFDKAEPRLQRAVDVGAKYADIFQMLGVIRHDRGDFEAAMEAFENALELNPNYTEAALNLVVTYNDLGRYEDARRLYQDILRSREEEEGGLDVHIKGRLANLHAALSDAYKEAGLLAEAMHELRKGVLLCPTFADLRVRLARLYLDARDYRGARLEL